MPSATTLFGTTLGGSAPFNADDIYVNPYTRAVPLYRINPFSVADGNGPSSFSAPYQFSDWANYSHNHLNMGGDVIATLGYGGEFTVSWDPSFGFDANVCRYRVSAKSTGAAPDTNADPLDTPDWQQFTTSNSMLVLGTVGHYYVVAVQVEFDDGNTAIFSNGFPGDVSETELSGPTDGIITSDRLPGSTPTMGSVTQSPDAEFCDDPVSDGLFVTVTFTSSGPSTIKVDMQINSDGWVTRAAALAAGSNSYSISAADAGFGDGDTVYFRVSYNDVSPTAWSSTASLTVFCGPV